jgi:hypothetical protein
MIKIKIKSLLSEVTSTAPMSNSQQPNTGFGIVDIIFKHYGFIPIQYLGGGQFSKVYLLDPVDTSKYEGMGRQRFIGKVSQSPTEYEAYKKAKDVKEQVSQDKAHPEYAKYLPTIYVAEQIDVGGFNSVIISEKLQKLDPNVQQLMYGGVESERGLTTIADYPARLAIVIEKFVKMNDVKDVIRNAFGYAIQSLSSDVDRTDTKAVNSISFNNFYDYLEASQYKIDENVVDELSRRFRNKPYNFYKDRINKFINDRKTLDKQQVMEVGKDALIGLCLKYASAYYKYIELQNIKSIDSFLLPYNTTTFYNKLFNMSIEEPMPLKHANIQLSSGFMSQEEPVKSFVDALDYIAVKYNFVFQDLHEDNVMMREDKTLVASDLGLFKK